MKRPIRIDWCLRFRLGDALIPQSNAILHYLEGTVSRPVVVSVPTPSSAPRQGRLRNTSFVKCMRSIVLRIRKFLAGKLNVDETGLEHWSQHWFADGFSKMEQALASRSQPFTFCYGEQPGWAELHLVPHMRKAITRFDVDVERYPIYL